MFRLRSIRRKLVLSLTLVVAMLFVQAGGGLSGLMSYRSLIQELDHEFFSGPRTSDVLAALSAVYEPLVWPDLDTAQGRKYRHAEVEGRLQKLRETINAYHRRFEAEQLPPDRRLLMDNLLHQVDDRLVQLQKHDTPRLLAADEAPAAVGRLQSELMQIQLTLLSIPRARHGFESRLEDARDVYHSRFWLIGISTTIAVLMFLLLANFTYRWIFAPIRELHQGASRVAQGDFGYRVRIRGDDEISQLADKFNQMTTRFEEIRDKLDGEVRQRTKQALRSERLAGVGFLAAGVAHEINNPLSAIAMAAESLEGRIQDAQSAGGVAGDELSVMTQYLGMIQRESFRCQQITQRLLDFSRGQDSPRTSQDLTRIIGEVLDMVGHMSRFRGYEIVFDRTRSVWLTVNGSEIKQVVLNLVANALESMTGVGRLEITLTEHADVVVMTFRDNGCGMTPQVLENLFEPFFTAKPSGRGTGLGLSITHRIVSDHGGRIEVASDGPGQGSTFEVHLPRRAHAAAAA